MTRSTFAMIIQSDISSSNGSASEFIPSCLNYIFIIVELLKQFWLWANDFIINRQVATQQFQQFMPWVIPL